MSSQNRQAAEINQSPWPESSGHNHLSQSREAAATASRAWRPKDEVVDEGGYGKRKPSEE